METLPESQIDRARGAQQSKKAAAPGFRRRPVFQVGFSKVSDGRSYPEKRAKTKIKGERPSLANMALLSELVCGAPGCNSGIRYSRAPLDAVKNRYGAVMLRKKRRALPIELVSRKSVSVLV